MHERQRAQLRALIPPSDEKGRRFVEAFLAFAARNPPPPDESLRDMLRRAAQGLPEGEWQQEMRRLEALLT